MDPDLLAEVKSVVCDAIGKRVDELKEEAKKYPFAITQAAVNIQAYSNLQTEICVSLDEQFLEPQREVTKQPTIK